MFRILDITSKCIVGCGLALGMFVPLAGAHAKSKETVLYSFCSQSGCPDGHSPTVPLIADSSGNLYGTAGDGGANGDYGTVFKVAPNGTETTLYSFCKLANCADGENPGGSLIIDSAGNLYGETSFGGANGHGTVFKLTPKGHETVLYYFSGGSDGYKPIGALIKDASGNLYGATEFGGTVFNCENGNYACGVVFKVAPNGTETVLYNFKGIDDAAEPNGSLVMDKKGNFYGTSGAGGDPSCSYGGTSNHCGTVFKLAPNGTETVLYAFQGGNDGISPNAGLLMDKKGNLYGATSLGGGSGCGGYGCGTVFKVAPDGTENVLWTFNGATNGATPYGGVIADASGNLYSTTSVGGEYNHGIVFKLTPKGNETVLYSFTGESDGDGPYGLIEYQGNFYGTTILGGANGWGTVFKITTK